MSTEATKQYPGKDLEAMSFAANYHRWIIDDFRPYLRGMVAEVGAGIGSVSQLLLMTAIDSLVAFEPSENLCPILSQALAADSRVTVVNDFFRPQHRDRFDTVVYINVLEHVQDDQTELSNIFEMLQRGGHLLLFVPALAWLFSNVDREVGHFRRYSKKALVSKVERAGFQLVHARYFDFAGILPWYVNFVLMKRSLKPGSVATYDNLVVPIMRKLERLVHPPVGKNLLAIAKKP